MADGRVHCFLCPRHCHIGEGQAGFCFIRVNQGGKLYSLGYASPAALQIDPIEKKPLNHFLPGSRVFSLGTAGCNMGCFFCQNWSISKSQSDQVRSTHIPPEDIVALAIRYGCPSIAFTYNEPTIWAEYEIDICQCRARSRHPHRDGHERVHHPGSFSRYLRSRGCRQRGLEGIYRRILRQNYSHPFAARARHSDVAERTKRMSGLKLRIC